MAEFQLPPVEQWYPALRARWAAHWLRTGTFVAADLAYDGLGADGLGRASEDWPVAANNVSLQPRAIVLLSAAAWRKDPELAAQFEARGAGRGGAVYASALEALLGAEGARELEPDGELVQRGHIRLKRVDAGGFEVRATLGGIRALLGSTPPPRPAADAAALETLVLAEDVRALTGKLVAADLQGEFARGAVLAVAGDPGTGKSAWVQAFARAVGRRLVRVDAARWSDLAPSVDAVHELFDRAEVDGELLAFDGCDAALSPSSSRVGGGAVLAARLPNHAGPVVLVVSGFDALDPGLDSAVHARFVMPRPAATERAALWARYAPGVDADERIALARRYELTGGQIALAAQVSRWLGDTHDAARMQLERERKPVTSGRMRLSDLVLPAEIHAQVSSIVAAARNRPRVLDAWGFGRIFSSGLAISALFHGEPGTGKTLAAEVIANELGMPLQRVNVAQVLDKYMGETEKNLERVFRLARASGSVLLFDEADALFSKRVSVEHSQDRAANLEINLLLQLVEQFDGIVILTTNLKQGIDQAFERRLGYKIDFPFPDEDLREGIWKRCLPPDAPVAADVDFSELARYELSGGSIKNAVLRAAYSAAQRGAGGLGGGGSPRHSANQSTGGATTADPATIDHDTLELAAEQECAAAGKLVGPRRGAELRDPFGI